MPRTGPGRRPRRRVGDRGRADSCPTRQPQLTTLPRRHDPGIRRCRPQAPARRADQRLYSSYSLCRQYRENLAEAVSVVAVPDDLVIDKIAPWHGLPAFVEITAGHVLAALADRPRTPRGFWGDALDPAGDERCVRTPLGARPHRPTRTRAGCGETGFAPGIRDPLLELVCSRPAAPPNRGSSRRIASRTRAGRSPLRRPGPDRLCSDTWRWSAISTPTPWRPGRQ